MVSVVFHTWFFQDFGNGLAVPLSCVGIELSSRAVSRKVFSPLQSLTSVFGMGTGGPSAFITPTLLFRAIALQAVFKNFIDP